jgi:hypothetical protein
MGLKDLKEGRSTFTLAENRLQAASLKISKKKHFDAHRHHMQPVAPIWRTEEAWVVVRGKVIVDLYDIDDSWLCTVVLDPGEAIITHNGGHSYTVFPDTLVYEFKSGPYLGKKRDKRYINDVTKESSW